MLTAYSGNVSKVLGQYFFEKLFTDTEAALVKNQTRRKWTMLSGHDTNVAPLLSFLNISSADCIEDKWQNSTKQYLNCEPGPDFAANLVFEIYTDMTVKVAYNGKYVNLCGRNATTCAYAELKDRVKQQYVPNADQACGRTKDRVWAKGWDFVHILRNLKTVKKDEIEL